MFSACHLHGYCNRLIHVGLDSNQSHAKGELPFEGIRMLRFALLGQLISFTILAVTTFLT